jgi:hypothetical protein
MKALIKPKLKKLESGEKIEKENNSEKVGTVL